MDKAYKTLLKKLWLILKVKKIRRYYDLILRFGYLKTKQNIK